jgi:serine/threonine-protein kinase RsbW
MNDGRPDDAALVGVASGADQPVVLLSQPFTAETVTDVRHTLAAQVTAVGLTGDDGDDFVLAAHELVTNAVRHGGGSGQVSLRRQGDVLICEVRDRGAGADRLPVRLPASDVPGGRGLWLAHQLTGTLMLTSLPGGVSAAVSVCLTPQAADSPAGPTSAVGASDAPDAAATEGDPP